MALISPTKKGDDVSVRQSISKLSSYKLGATASVKYASAILTDLTASRLVYGNADKSLTSVANLSAWVAGTANRVTVANDGDGSITLNTPQDLHTSAANFTVTGLTTTKLISTPDEIEATDAGVAASIATVNTEVTTNDDNDLDNVTLANGTSGQIKHIYCVASFAGDTWKITPLTMCGGTQITFGDNSVGNGCTLVYADDEGWVVVANNGGTIT